MKLIHCDNVFSTLPVLSYITSQVTMAYIPYVYQVKPLRESDAGLTLMLIFRVFTIYLIPSPSSPLPFKKPLLEYHRFASVQIFARRLLFFSYALRGNSMFLMVCKTSLCFLSNSRWILYEVVTHLAFYLHC